MNILRELTKQYIYYFDQRNLAGVASLLMDSFVLEDPVVKRIENKSDALDAIKNIFDSCTKLSFQAKNIFQEGSTTIIEFVLVLDDTTLTGVDIIEWRDQKIVELRAYLDVPKED